MRVFRFSHAISSAAFGQTLAILSCRCSKFSQWSHVKGCDKSYQTGRRRNCRRLRDSATRLGYDFGLWSPTQLNRVSDIVPEHQGHYLQRSEPHTHLKVSTKPKRVLSGPVHLSQWNTTKKGTLHIIVDLRTSAGENATQVILQRKLRNLVLKKQISNTKNIDCRVRKSTFVTMTPIHSCLSKLLCNNQIFC